MLAAQAPFWRPWRLFWSATDQEVVQALIQDLQAVLGSLDIRRDFLAAPSAGHAASLARVVAIVALQTLSAGAATQARLSGRSMGLDSFD